MKVYNIADFKTNLMPIKAEQIITNKRPCKQKTEHDTITQPIDRLIGGSSHNHTLRLNRTEHYGKRNHRIEHIRLLSLVKRSIIQPKGGF